MAENQVPDSIKRDVVVLEAMAAEMEPYLKSDLLYWRLSPEKSISPPPSMLTIGGALLRVKRLEGSKEELEPEQYKRMKAARSLVEEAMAEWKAHAGQKMARELEARLNSWREYANDCQERRQSCLSGYPNGAEKRTIAELLIDKASGFADVSEFRERVEALDAGFRPFFAPGEFIWDMRLTAVFPLERFWWLYGGPEIKEV